MHRRLKLMNYKSYMGYELGHFLMPRYEGYHGGEVFFLLLQNIYSDPDAEEFFIKLGKTRLLGGDFHSDCLKVLLYLKCNNDEQFSVHNIELTSNKDGRKVFDAVGFLDKMGIAYEANDTSHYRYFKSRLYQKAREIRINIDEDFFAVVHKPIDADDYEKIHVFHNYISELLQQGFFLLTSVSDRMTNYHDIEYFQTEEELMCFIKNEYEHTDAEIVTTYSLSDLLQGQQYAREPHQGTSQSTIRVLLVHKTNLNKLFRFLDEVKITDKKGTPVQLSSLIKTAKDSASISKIIDIYNEYQDNYW